MMRWVLLLSLILALVADVAWAHGGGVPQLVNEQAGPYWVSVRTQPNPLRVGQAHITVAVSEPTDSADGGREAGSPVLEATVRVVFRSMEDQGRTLTALATHEGATNKLFYEADVELVDTGRWQVQVTIDGPEGFGSAAFEAQVSPPQTSSWPWIGGLGVVALAAFWVVQRIRDREGED